MILSIVVVGTLTHCALLYNGYDLKTTQMNVKHGLICKLMFYMFEQDHYTIGMMLFWVEF